MKNMTFENGQIYFHTDSNDVVNFYQVVGALTFQQIGARINGNYSMPVATELIGEPVQFNGWEMELNSFHNLGNSFGVQLEDLFD